MELAPLSNNPFSCASSLQNQKRQEWKILDTQSTISAKPDDLHPIPHSIFNCILALWLLFCSHCLKIIKRKERWWRIRVAVFHQTLILARRWCMWWMPNYPSTPTQISPLRGYVALVTCPTLIARHNTCFLSTKFKIYSLLGSFHSQASHCCWISAILRLCFTSTYIA